MGNAKSTVGNLVMDGLQTVGLDSMLYVAPIQFTILSFSDEENPITDLEQLLNRNGDHILGLPLDIQREIFKRIPSTSLRESFAGVNRGWRCYADLIGMIPDPNWIIHHDNFRPHCFSSRMVNPDLRWCIKYRAIKVQSTAERMRNSVRHVQFPFEIIGPLSSHGQCAATAQNIWMIGNRVLVFRGEDGWCSWAPPIEELGVAHLCAILLYTCPSADGSRYKIIAGYRRRGEGYFGQDRDEVYIYKSWEAEWRYLLDVPNGYMLQNGVVCGGRVFFMAVEKGGNKKAVLVLDGIGGDGGSPQWRRLSAGLPPAQIHHLVSTGKRLLLLTLGNSIELHKLDWTGGENSWAFLSDLESGSYTALVAGGTVHDVQIGTTSSIVVLRNAMKPENYGHDKDFYCAYNLLGNCANKWHEFSVPTQASDFKMLED